MFELESPLYTPCAVQLLFAFYFHAPPIIITASKGRPTRVGYTIAQSVSDWKKRLPIHPTVKVLYHSTFLSNEKFVIHTYIIFTVLVRKAAQNSWRPCRSRFVIGLGSKSFATSCFIWLSKLLRFQLLISCKLGVPLAWSCKLFSKTVLLSPHFLVQRGKYGEVFVFALNKWSC